jgi:hypothetical protein
MSVPSPLLRGLIAGLAGGVAWFAGLIVFFGPAQAVLTDPAFQSPKFLAAFTADPAPRISAAPWLLGAGLLGIGVLWGLVYVWLAGDWRGSWRRRGLRFGAVAWVMMVPWFEFYLPWNVMREPAPLVALEMACWAGVLLGTGLAIAGVDAALAPGSIRPGRTKP